MEQPRHRLRKLMMANVFESFDYEIVQRPALMKDRATHAELARDVGG